ncbi:MAG: acyl-[acyl-carrier-protein]--UDP-N-acetylglucosamine O-acyltransferase [Polaromonas sp. 39-63-203]|jgi:UDP-N-acetylglucosamine acyltransferase|uniref:acyl-ACP--UDP-N-acetylglucosamine O-acyltransferase n=1 Tax=Polaromonas sp. TaxID=1869339 RepID=UPI000BC4EDC9|nr:acyl-ACP--UDP-N-acetylglucosamine O-acyltransferase [Polaromonas sp.]OYY51743.1 MAG: acyl-[acyl-carrier-protein]--UDP-N-acetylglucosamine O-acyltransferase [Polaromonas sp. 35-63-240]OYY96077.1 MAG: acyl-[acyl-carrier-protein]--UDP-N-acetylglucosamine O-acyltransferase [Polaromonas sp. 28-63-22]OYZ83335.1 MAG: acyl-[acyl-carrier-protein]--UDP-N-acetylglucosamine O-acyltransferase [Polaromonas sp. 24-62-144]OZA96661.1 MAG: acyl-[acyl-carrier-protein]--UDP-N-acetylglucosamine O-acyltransferase
MVAAGVKPGIHATALIDPLAQLDSSVSVGPYTVIGPHVRVGAGTSIGAHCVIEGHTTIGQDNRIFQFNSLGAIPQDKKYAGEPCELVIGDRNTIREFCTFNIGSPGAGGVTRLGDDNWIMAYVHLAHDCIVGNQTIFANNSQLAGHVHVGDWAILGGFTVAHQFVRIGAHSMTALCSVLLADLPPFVMAQGQPARARSMNFEGLRRRGFSPERIAAVKAMHKALYRDDLTLDSARERIDGLVQSHPASVPDVQLMLAFLADASPQRGIVR